MPEALSFRVTVNYKNEAGKEKGNVMYIKVFMPPIVKYFKVMSIKAIDVVNSGKYGNLHFTSNLEKYTSLFTLMSSTHISCQISHPCVCLRGLQRFSNACWEFHTQLGRHNGVAVRICTRNSSTCLSKMI